MYLYTAHLNKKSQGTKSQQNQNVFRNRLNSLRHMSRCRSSTDRLFHSRGPATAKLLSPSCVCVRGTAQVWTSPDRGCRRPRSVTSWQSSDRYEGVRPWRDLYTSTAILRSTRCLTSSQWSCFGTGVMWSRRRGVEPVRYMSILVHYYFGTYHFGTSDFGTWPLRYSRGVEINPTVSVLTVVTDEWRQPVL